MPHPTLKQLIDNWKNLPFNALEKDVENSFITPLLDHIGIGVKDRKTDQIAAGLRPDYLIYANGEPLLVIEVKKRDPRLAQVNVDNFEQICRENLLYRDAVGISNSLPNNGIKQYLEKNDNNPINDNKLAHYGLVIGEFFQFWRRSEGLVYPITSIHKTSATSIPKLVNWLKTILTQPRLGLVNLFWNQKGGVAKTTNTLNIGATLAIKNKKVLLIDLDPQSDLASSLGVSYLENNWLMESLEKAYFEESETIRALLQNNIRSRTFPTSTKTKFTIDVLPNFLDFRDYLRGDISLIEGLEIKFKRLLESIQTLYDYIFIDMSPTPNRLTPAVLYSTDIAITGVEYGTSALQHGVKFHNSYVPQVRSQRDKRHGIFIGPWNAGFVYSKVQSEPSQALRKEVDKSLADLKFTGKQYNTQLYSYAMVVTASMKKAPVVCWQSSPISTYFDKLVKEIYLNHNFIWN